MDCPKCSAKVEDKKLYCPQCGHRFQLDPIEGEVMSMEEWKLRKFKEKDQARKDKMKANRDKYDAIKDRMYSQQSGFEVEDLITQVEEKKNEETGPVTTQRTAEPEPDVRGKGKTKYSELFNFEDVTKEVMNDLGRKKKESGKKKYVRGEAKKTKEVTPELQPIEESPVPEEQPKKRRRRRKIEPE